MPMSGEGRGAPRTFIAANFRECHKFYPFKLTGSSQYPPPLAFTKILKNTSPFSSGYGQARQGTDIKWKPKTHCTCENKIQFLNFKFTTAVVLNKSNCRCYSYTCASISIEYRNHWPKFCPLFPYFKSNLIG